MRKHSPSPGLSRSHTLSILLVTLLLAGSQSARAQDPPVPDRPTRYTEPLSERRVAYTIDVTLEPNTRSLRGTETLTWRNPDQVPVGELQFHLYLNAFRNAESTFMRERGWRMPNEDQRGSIDVTQLRLLDAPAPGAEPFGTDLLPTMSFIQPDDGNPNDRTVMRVLLPEPVPPGESVTLTVGFEARLPLNHRRTGWIEKPDGKMFFMGAQWFPKLGVYEVPGQRYVPADAPSGQWNTHQFHANSEFYADYGTYEVHLTVPEDYIVGASGIRTDDRVADGLRRLSYRAEDVHDFAWTASNDFEVVHDEWRHVQLRLLIQPEHAHQAARHLDAAKVALQYFDDWYGEYPYTTLTLVDGLGDANGMEYPTLITCGTYYFMPEWFRVLELVIVHEFGHQYWYGLLGNNEFEEAWLDEGINSYTEMRIMDEAYPSGAVIGFPGLEISNEAFQRTLYTKNAPRRGAIFTRAWEHPFGDYGKTSYQKPAVVLGTLENYLGTATMRRILRTYYERWRFRHPTTRDFITVAEEVTGESLAWFFDPFVYGTDAVDYAVTQVRADRLPKEIDSETRYESSVWVERRETGVFPQTLRVRFADGRTEDIDWDGAEAWKEFTFAEEITEAYLDPENKVLLDINRLNNRSTTSSNRTFARKYGLKFIVWLQQSFTLLSGLF